MKNKTLKERVAEQMEKCIYFNGAMNDECKAGVKYDAVCTEGAGVPCVKLGNRTLGQRKSQCSNLTTCTREDAEKEIKDRDAWIVKTLTELANGICPNCQQKVQQRQVGSCVYGTCGHRLYQGTVNPDYAA